MRILLLEGNPDDAATIAAMLKSSGVESPDVTWASRLPVALQRLAEGPFDVLLVDIAVPGGRGVDVVSRLHAEAPSAPIVVLNDVRNEPLALEALRCGAQDHVLKPQIERDHEILGRALAYAVERQWREEEIERRRHEADVLGGIAQSVNSTLDLDAILRRAAEWTRELCGADVGAIALVEPDGRAIVRHVAGHDRARWTGRTIGPDDPEWGSALRGGRPLRTEPGRADAPGARLAVPMVSPDGIEGLLCTENETARAFTDHDELLLLRLADVAAIAIRNARLYALEQTARAAAETSESRLRLLFANAPAPMWVADAETSAFLAVNEATVRHYGYTEAELLRLRTTDVRVSDAADGGGVRAERHRAKDGRLMDLEIATHPFAFDGHPAVLALVQDVTARRRAEDALHANEERLLQLERLEATSRLAASVARELTNLVTVIQGHATLALDTAGADRRLANHLEAIQAAALRTSTLNARLLAFGQQQALHPTTVALGAVVNGMEAMIRQVVGEHVRLFIQAAPDAGLVLMDRAQLERTIMSLVVNARDAMPEGGHLMLEVLPATLDEHFVARHTAVAPGAYVLLAVSDTGHGMAEDVRARAFEPTFTTRETDETRGWGLATAYGIVRQSGGEIVVYSEPDRGTTVRIYLPRAVTDNARATPSDEHAWRGQETVLLVEDETQVRQLAVEVLESYGYRVLEARYPEEALAIGERHAGPIDLVLTDVVMAGLTGPQVVSRLLARRPDMKVLYMSGYTDAALTQHGAPVRSDALLEKPFTAHELAGKVRTVLDRDAAGT